MNHPFIQRVSSQNIDQQLFENVPIEETNLSSDGGNLYKFYMAYCLNEIVYRFTSNIRKLD